MASPKYYIKPPYDRQVKLITLRRDTGELINLLGEEVKETLPANQRLPERVVTARGAKDADLKYLLESEETGNWSKIIGVRGKIETKELVPAGTSK